MGHFEVVVGIAARHLRDIGETIVDESDTGQCAAREHAIDCGAVGGLDQLVGMWRRRPWRFQAQRWSAHRDRSLIGLPPRFRWEAGGSR